MTSLRTSQSDLTQLQPAGGQPAIAQPMTSFDTYEMRLSRVWREMSRSDTIHVCCVHEEKRNIATQCKDCWSKVRAYKLCAKFKKKNIRITSDISMNICKREIRIKFTHYSYRPYRLAMNDPANEPIAPPTKNIETTNDQMRSMEYSLSVRS